MAFAEKLSPGEYHETSLADKSILIHTITLVKHHHYADVIMDTIGSQITSLLIVYSTIYSDTDQRKHPSSASLTFVRGIHWGQVNYPHKWIVTRKMFPFQNFELAQLTEFDIHQTDYTVFGKKKSKFTCLAHCFTCTRPPNNEIYREFWSHNELKMYFHK